MAPPQASTTAEATARSGAHVLEVPEYSRCCMGAYAIKCVASAAFAAGGYDWAVRFFPGGSASAYVSADFVLVTGRARVRASFNLGLVNRATGLPSFAPEDATAVFDTTTVAGGVPGHASHGRPQLMKSDELEESPDYLGDDDTVAVACVVTVVGGGTVSDAEAAAPPDMAQHLGELLRTGDGADVTFDVDGEEFAAHSIILASRSPVLEAELSEEPMSDETRTHRVTVHGVRPAVFRALLHFIYTDSVPAVDDDTGAGETREFFQDLLAASDRYAMERLKAVCEVALARMLDADTVAATLALADRYCCKGLADACVDFIRSSKQVVDVERSITDVR